jgi:hypothetical protein
MSFQTIFFAVVLGIAFSPLGAAQNQAAQDASPAAPPAVEDDYPRNQVGVLIRGAEWISVPTAMPTKTRAKHGFAPMLTYGVAPAAMVAEYEGAHAAVQVGPGQPVICFCRMISLPAQPALVRLHPKKGIRELDAGKLHVGIKTAQAEATDLIPVTVSQPEEHVWLIRPDQALPVGEYALMIGTQNMGIFPFSVAETGAPAAEKH